MRVCASKNLLLLLGMLLSLAPAAAVAGGRAQLATATFAGGCFWCMEPPYDALAGVVSTTAGYTGGDQENPSYRQVSSGGSGHLEAVQVLYDPAEIRYEQLLAVYWRNVDPLDGGGQFCDRGPQYRSAIFYHDDEQRRAAEQAKGAVEGELARAVATEIRPAVEFYPAEEYHQDYYRENPLRYKFYRYRCGRDQRLETLWGERPPAATQR